MGNALERKSKSFMIQKKNSQEGQLDHIPGVRTCQEMENRRSELERSNDTQKL